jgi:hypothetical protein
LSSQVPDLELIAAVKKNQEHNKKIEEEVG